VARHIRMKKHTPVQVGPPLINAELTAMAS
jgi:hypothetical protein